MRSAYCREHIDKTVMECGLSENTRYQVKQAEEFEKEHPEFDFSNCGTETILAVKRIKEPEVQKQTIAEMIKARNAIDPKTGKEAHASKFTEKEVKEITSRAQKIVAEMKEKENLRLAEEARKAKEEVAANVAPLPAIHTKAVDVIQVVKKAECAAEEARNNPVTELDEKHVAPKNSLKESYGQQVVGVNKIPDLANEAPLGKDREGIKILIATANDCIQDMLRTDKELLVKRHEYKEQIEQIEEEIAPLREAIDALEDKIKAKRGMIKSVDNERQRIGLSIQDQHARILKLKKEMEG